MNWTTHYQLITTIKISEKTNALVFFSAKELLSLAKSLLQIRPFWKIPTFGGEVVVMVTVINFVIGGLR